MESSLQTLTTGEMDNVGIARSSPKAPCKPSFVSRLIGKMRWHRRGTQTILPSASGSRPTDSSSKVPSPNQPLGSTVPEVPSKPKVPVKPLPDIPASTPSSHSWNDLSDHACKDSLSERQSPNVSAHFSTKVEAADNEVIPTPILVLPPSPRVNANQHSQVIPTSCLLQPRRERIIRSISPNPSSVSGHLGGDLFDPMKTPGTLASSLPLSIKPPEQMGVIGMPGLPLELEYGSIQYHFMPGRNPIGTGVSGKVYLALSPQKPGRQFAVKVVRKVRCINKGIPMTQEAYNKWEDITPIFTERVVAEANILQSCIEEPSLFLVYPEAILQDYNFYYFIMPNYPISLHDFIANTPNPLTLDLDTCMWCTQQIVLGLQELHKHSIAHLDIKPLNIMIKSSGYLCLIDFGHSVRIPESQVIPRITCGTSGYLAPELRLSDPNSLVAPAAADVYSLGRTMLDMYLSYFTHENDFDKEIWKVAQRSESAAMLISLMTAPVKQRLTLDQVEQLIMLQKGCFKWEDMCSGTADPPLTLLMRLDR